MARDSDPRGTETHSDDDKLGLVPWMETAHSKRPYDAFLVRRLSRTSKGGAGTAPFSPLTIPISSDSWPKSKPTTDML